MRFRIGDKVRLKDPTQFSLGTKILTIIEADCGDRFVPVTFDGMRVFGYFPVKPCEIEHISTTGQLLFDFMSATEGT